MVRSGCCLSQPLLAVDARQKHCQCSRWPSALGFTLATVSTAWALVPQSTSNRTSALEAGVHCEGERWPPLSGLGLRPGRSPSPQQPLLRGTLFVCRSSPCNASIANCAQKGRVGHQQREGWRIPSCTRFSFRRCVASTVIHC